MCIRDRGYTVLKKDENGNSIREVDWEKTRAVQIRSNYIYINLKGRDAHGIVDPADKYDLEEQIISDLYNYRDDRTGKRVVGICLRNKDGVLLGVNGPECGDIFFSIEEGYNRLHGDSISTSEAVSYTHLMMATFTNEYIKGYPVAYTAITDIDDLVQAENERAITYNSISGFAARFWIRQDWQIEVLDANEQFKAFFGEELGSPAFLALFQKNWNANLHVFAGQLPNVALGRPVQFLTCLLYTSRCV